MRWLQPILADIAALAVPALYNIYFALASIPLGFALAILVALAKASPNPFLSRLARGYIYLFRGTPFFIQLFFVYALALSLNLGVWKPLGIDWLVLHPLFLGPFVLTLNTTAYTAEILHGALLAVPRGELEAATSFGMTPRQRFRAVTWPHVIRLAWPAYTNEVVFLFQATALIYFTLPVIGDQQDLMNRAGELFQRDYNLLLHFGTAALYFLAISLTILAIFNTIYAHLMRHTATSKPRLTFQLLR